MERLRVLRGHLAAAPAGDVNVTRTPTDAQEAPAEAVDVSYWARSGINCREDYERLHALSLRDPADFWANFASEFHWHKQWEREHVSWIWDAAKGPIGMSFFKGGRTNVCYNALDRHVALGSGERACFLWEGSEPGVSRRLSYSQTLAETCRLANWLKSVGVRKGDAVCVYMPLLPELPIAMLACARVGAVHSVVFGGFSAESLAQRVVDCKSKVIITASGGLRGSKKVELKAIVDAACNLAAEQGFQVASMLVLEHAAARAQSVTPITPRRDAWWHEAVSQQPAECAVEWVDAEDPLFLLYTSGSTGSPKGVLHTTGGYMVQAAVSARYVFDLQPGDVYWCTADCGWITGHTYLTYGPLLCGATNVVYEGVPAYPSPARVWQIVEKHRVRQLYTSPTLIRALEAHGDSWVQRHDLSSLRVLGTVGEPISPAAWRWYHQVVGGGRCPIVDTWWQTETGSIAISGLPGAWPQKPGCASLPFFGVRPLLLDDKGRELPPGPGEGILALAQPWPSMLRTLRGDHARFESAYFSAFPGKYFTGDGARIDADGYVWITGRVDDVINVSGHRVGTAEVEAALCSTSDCVEAAVVGTDHAIKGQALYAFVVLSDGAQWSDSLKRGLAAAVRSQIGAFAVPDALHLAPGLPKTRSGKIMRRVLRKVAAGEEGQLGDLSTLAEPEIVKRLLELRGK